MNKFNGELRHYPEALTESEFRLLFSLRRHLDGNRIARVLAGDLDRLVAARDKHTDFACGQYEALANLEAEAGEVTQEIVKGREGWEARMARIA